MRDLISSITYEQSTGRGNLTFAEREALSNLSADNSIVINRADKANAIVIQNHVDYALEGLKHPAVYRKLPYDTTSDVEMGVINFINRMYRDGLINKEMADFAHPTKSVRTARVYFLKKKKTHKNPMGIRRIVSSVDTATENLSQLVDIWLQPIMRQLPSEGIDCAVSALDLTYQDLPPPQVIGNMINVILSNNVFEFEGQHYLQIQGCAMGTRCAPAYASIFMGHVEKTLQSMAGDLVLL